MLLTQDMKVVHSHMSQKLIQGCIDRERSAQKRLYEKFYGKMMGVCLRYTSSYDEAQEILNTGFFKVFNTIANYRPTIGNLDGWIYRIMVNCAIDHYRREQRHRNHNTLEDHHAIPSNTPDVVSVLSADEILELVQQLPPGYRTVFNLFVVEGYSHKEIAEKLEIAEGTSKSNLAKARGKLQVMIANLEKRERKEYAR